MITKSTNANKPASSKVVGLIFSKIFPHSVVIADDRVPEECYEWLKSRFPANSADPEWEYTWITNRTCAFKDPKHAMEFKLIWG